MRIFSKILPMVLAIAFLAPAAFASEGIYDQDLVRGFITLKGDFRSMKSSGVRFINEATGESYSKGSAGGHVEIGAEYNQLHTWFDIGFMPYTPSRGSTEWFSYGVTWMWGYKLLSYNSAFNIIPSVGPGVELINIRTNPRSRVNSSFGPTLNLELELRLQAAQFSAGVYGGYKVERHYDWDELSSGPWTYDDINADKAFIGLKFTWTMLNNFQKRERELK